MIHFFLMSAGGLSESQTLVLSQTATISVPGILSSGVKRTHLMEYAQADNSYLYMANGISPVTKWDGLTPAVVEAGVASPTAGPTLSFAGTGGTITGNYQAYVRFIDIDGNVSNLSLPSALVNTTESTTAIYEGVAAAPQPSRIVRRQILRNAAGSLLIFYVDIDTTDLTSTSFTSVKDDDALRASEIVPLFDATLTLNLVNFHGLPPDDKPLISFYQNRLWLYGNTSYEEGMIQVTNNSKTVTGIGTSWTAQMVDRLLYVNDAEKFYQIDSVNTLAQTLTLVDEYREVTNKFATYAIQSNADRRHLLCYSEALQPDSWRPTTGIKIASSDDLDDEGTALISTQSFLYAAQRRHIYRITFFQEPTIDGGVFLAARRGCINNRCWLNVDGFVYMLDDRGIYKFDGSDGTDELSAPIQDIFFFDRPDGELRLNWASSKFWHAHHDRNDATMRWFVGLSGSLYPRHALCFNYVNPQWWIEEYPWPVTDSTLLKTINPIPLTASKYNKVFAVGIGTLDDVSGSGDTYGKVVSSSLNTLTVPPEFSPPSSLAGTPVAITSGRGKGQQRIIASVTGQELTLTHPWIIRPDSTSSFRIGGIVWNWKGQWSRWNPGEIQQTRRVTATFQPADGNTTMDLRIYEDYSETPNVNTLDWPINESGSSGVVTNQGDSDAVVDLSLPKGFAYLTLDDLKAYDEWRRDVISVEIRGFSGEKAVRIYQLDIEGAASER
jgi:hypothetical protein